MWDEQVRTKGVDKHEEDQISFGDALARACLQRSAEILCAGPSIHPEAWFSEKVLCQRKMQTQPKEAWTVRVGA